MHKFRLTRRQRKFAVWLTHLQKNTFTTEEAVQALFGDEETQEKDAKMRSVLKHLSRKLPPPFFIKRTSKLGRGNVGTYRFHLNDEIFTL